MNWEAIGTTYSFGVMVVFFWLFFEEDFVTSLGAAVGWPLLFPLVVARGVLVMFQRIFR